MILDVTFERCLRNIWKFKARASVDGVTAAEAELMCTVKHGAAAVKGDAAGAPEVPGGQP